MNMSFKILTIYRDTPHETVSIIVMYATICESTCESTASSIAAGIPWRTEFVFFPINLSGTQVHAARRGRCLSPTGVDSSARTRVASYSGPSRAALNIRHRIPEDLGVDRRLQNQDDHQQWKYEKSPHTD